MKEKAENFFTKTFEIMKNFFSRFIAIIDCLPLKTFKEKLKNYRTAGLEKGGEFSYENLTFKFLRRNGYIDKIFNFRDSDTRQPWCATAVDSDG